MWGDPAKVTTTPVGHRVRVALGTAAWEGRGVADMWEMRVTDPDDDLSWVFGYMIPAEHLAHLAVSPEWLWETVEDELMACYDREHADR